LPTYITINSDKSFTFLVKTPATSWLLKKAAGIEKGSARAGNVTAATLSLKHIYEIALIKKKDKAFQDSSLEQVASRVIGQARSMGIEIVP
jgi:large subunit ribosomal protein L11